ncbi:MAG TPA: tetratricopeptide repeat protein [Phycisphaerae bacterium]|nr:tetratricopeptide repeat protein [Phycisphaerae bacterium]
MNYEAEMYVWLGDDKRLQAKPLLKIPYDASEEVVKALQAEADRLHNEALAFYEKAVTLAPDSVVARVHLGYLLKNMRRYQEALQHLDVVLQQEPDFLAYFYRGDVYSRMRDQERALRDFTSCVEAEPRFKPGLLARSAIYQGQGRVEEAKADCRRVLELCAQVTEYQEARRALKQQIEQVRARAKAEGRALTQSEIEYIKPREEMIGILNYRIENHPDRDAAHSASARLRQLEQQS